MEKQITKEEYFALVDLKKALRAEYKQLGDEWNERVAWDDDLNARSAHTMKEAAILEQIMVVTNTIQQAMDTLSKETLNFWANEYYGR